jgi:acyl carrier protein
MDLKAKLKQMVIEELYLENVTPDGIDDAAPLFGEGLGLDSLDALQLAVALEERFAVRVEDEAQGRAAFASINALAAFVESRTESGAEE